MQSIVAVRKNSQLIMLLTFIGTHCAMLFADDASALSSTIDLTHWKLTLPIDADGTKVGKAAEISAARLIGGFTNADFFHFGPLGALVFWCPVDGARTEGTDYPRCELRETIDPTDDNINWTSRGTHRLEARCRVIAVPSSQKVIIGQIHSFSGDAKPLVKLQYFKGRLEALIKLSPSKNQDRKLTLGNVEPNSLIDYRIQLHDGVLTVTVNGRTQTADIRQNDSGWDRESFYFKAGAYCQDNTGPSSEGARVVFSSLTTFHAEPVISNAVKTPTSKTSAQSKGLDQKP